MSQKGGPNVAQPTEFKLARVAGEQWSVPQRAEGELALVQLRKRSDRCNSDRIDHELSGDLQRLVCLLELKQNPREILQDSTGGHRETDLAKN